MGFGWGFGFGIFPVFTTFIIILVFAVIVFVIFKGLSQWRGNNASPILTVEASVAAKRTEVNTYMTRYPNGMAASDVPSASTAHFVTFEVESGDRMELQMSGSEYGMLAEGDFGRLTFQGTRYLGFERRKQGE